MFQRKLQKQPRQPRRGCRVVRFRKSVGDFTALGRVVIPNIRRKQYGLSVMVGPCCGVVGP